MSAIWHSDKSGHNWQIFGTTFVDHNWSGYCWHNDSLIIYVFCCYHINISPDIIGKSLYLNISFVVSNGFHKFPYSWTKHLYFIIIWSQREIYQIIYLSIITRRDITTWKSLNHRKIYIRFKTCTFCLKYDYL